MNVEVQCAVCHTKVQAKSKARKYCGDVCKGRVKYIDGSHTTEAQYKYISGNWGRYINRLTSGSRNNDRREYGITKEYVMKLLETQNYRCALTGIELTCQLQKGVKNLNNASIDRIDSSKGYVAGNVHLVCHAINQLKLSMSVETFVRYCTAVATHAKERENAAEKTGS